MIRFRKRPARTAPSHATVEAEAMAFRSESTELRNEITLLRSEISMAMVNLADFSQALRDGAAEF